MGGGNCAFFGCPTSGKHEISLFKIPTVKVSDGEDTKESKQRAREEWLRLILRTREMTPELKKRIEKNNIFICERHFKAECILAGECWFVLCSIRILAYTANCS
jgi:lipoate synthase